MAITSPGTPVNRGNPSDEALLEHPRIQRGKDGAQLVVGRRAIE